MRYSTLRGTRFCFIENCLLVGYKSSFKSVQFGVINEGLHNKDKIKICNYY